MQHVKPPHLHWSTVDVVADSREHLAALQRQQANLNGAIEDASSAIHTSRALLRAIDEVLSRQG